MTRDELRASKSPSAVTNGVWDGHCIKVFGAKNEVVSFNLVLEAEQNLRAAGHPLGSNGKIRPDLGRQSHAYLIDASVGQTKNKGDFQVGYSWWRIEQDAILASFAESDQRAPSNILQNRVYGQIKIAPNTIASYTLWIGHTLNPNLQHAVLAPGWTTALGSNEPSLKRQQFDLIYTF